MLDTLALKVLTALPLAGKGDNIPDVNLNNKFLGEVPQGIWVLLGAVGGVVIFAGLLYSGVVGGGQIMFANNNEGRASSGWTRVKNGLAGSGVVAVSLVLAGAILAFLFTIL